MGKTILDTLMLIINDLGYVGILVSTCLEYACFPVSSELLLPFIGYTVSKGELNILITILICTLGGIVGCCICYFIGRFGGSFIEKTIAKKFRNVKKGISHAMRFFDKYGKYSVLIGRMFPLVRTYISIPAGMAKMDFLTFITYSAAGALLWNTLLVSIGYFLGGHWSEAKSIIVEYEFLIYAVLFAVIVLICFKLIRKRLYK